jgi:hypothetical protein
LEGLKHVKQIGKLRNANEVDRAICRVFSLEKIIIFQVLNFFLVLSFGSSQKKEQPLKVKHEAIFSDEVSIVHINFKGEIYSSKENKIIPTPCFLTCFLT